MILTGYARLVKSKEKLLFAPRFPRPFYYVSCLHLTCKTALLKCIPKMSLDDSIAF